MHVLARPPMLSLPHAEITSMAAVSNTAAGPELVALNHGETIDRFSNFIAKISLHSKVVDKCKNAPNSSLNSCGQSFRHI